MGKDLKVTWAEVSPVISSVTVVSFEPLTIDVKLTGRMRSITKVVVDDVPCSSFTLLPDQSTIRALPDSDGVAKVRVFGEPMSLDGAEATFAIRGPRAVYGPEKLLQTIIRLFLTESGSILGYEDVFGRPDLHAVPKEGRPAAIQTAIFGIEQAIKRSQRTTPPSVPMERLMSIQVLEVAELPGASYRVTMNIVTAGGSILRSLSVEA